MSTQHGANDPRRERRDEGDELDEVDADEVEDLDADEDAENVAGGNITFGCPQT